VCQLIYLNTSPNEIYDIFHQFLMTPIELSGASGYLILFTQIAHLGIMGDFFYYYFISLSRGLPMELPTTRSMV
jgi:hypothetical protein